MSVESVKKHFVDYNLDLKVMELENSTATVELAAQTLGVEPGQIAKTMGLRLKDRDILILSKGDARIDNKKFKNQFNVKAKMISIDEIEAVTGHPVGGVCPFGLKEPLDIYLDESLKEYQVVYPAAGGKNAAVEISVDELAEVTLGTWVDVCK